MRKEYAYHAPSPGVVEKMGTIREAFSDLAATIDRLVPAGRERSLAHTAIEGGAMWAMKALSHGDPDAKVVS